MIPSLVDTKCQLYGAVKGLKYLHEANLTHGDLKGVRSWVLLDASVISHSLAGEYSHDKRHAPYGVSRGFWVHHHGV